MPLFFAFDSWKIPYDSFWDQVYPFRAEHSFEEYSSIFFVLFDHIFWQSVSMAKVINKSR